MKLEKYEVIGTFVDPRYPTDTIHTVYDAGLQFGAKLHRFINGGRTACSAIYHGDEQQWWTYTNGSEYVGDENEMIKDWQNLDFDITRV